MKQNGRWLECQWRESCGESNQTSRLGPIIGLGGSHEIVGEMTLLCSHCSSTKSAGEAFLSEGSGITKLSRSGVTLECPLWPVCALLAWKNSLPSFQLGLWHDWMIAYCCPRFLLSLFSGILFSLYSPRVLEISWRAETQLPTCLTHALPGWLRELF